MMKKIILFILFLSTITAYTQTLDTIKTPSVQNVSEDSDTSRYPGGMMKFRKDLADKINLNRIKGINGMTGTITSKAKIIINAKGKIEDILVTGDNADFNKEIIRAIKSMKNRLKPLESNGKVVRSYFSFPLTLSFE
ncbi:energy transducer TonB [Chryseobacterium sp. 22532]|uniref:energy transducer TonB n=1 Tax=Chryseobacterium sp. 22532 TaxID=3453938 RepID=UPI003F8381CE